MSTNTHLSRSPIARWTSSAVTAESTPPESAQITRPSSPTAARIFATASSTNEAAFQSRLQPQMSRKLASTVRPCSVWFTSGWKRMPKRARSRFSIAATGLVLLEPVTLKPAGGWRIESPWLIHTRAGTSNPRSSGEPSWRSNEAWPYSRRPAGFTSPPSTWLMSCMP